MKIAILLLAVPLAVQGISITVIDNQTAALSQTLVFDVVWGPGPGPSSSSEIVAGGSITNIIATDLSTSAGLTLLVLEGPNSRQWDIMLQYGGQGNFIRTQADRLFTAVEPDYVNIDLEFPLVSNSSIRPYMWTLDAEPIADPYGGRFSFTAQTNPQFLPDAGATAPILLAALGLLCLARRWVKAPSAPKPG